MIWHPLTWAFWAVAATGGMLYLLAAANALTLISGWAPHRYDAQQLHREQCAQTVHLAGRWALVSMTVATLIALAGVAIIWHRIVPGAMCGTGVMQALGAAGRRGALFWLVFLAILYAWRVVDGLNQHDPLGAATVPAARLLLVAAPFVVLALIYSGQALLQGQEVAPVSCCAAFYDRVLSSPDTASNPRLWPDMSFVGHLAISLWLALAVRRALVRNAPGCGALIAALAMVWLPLATVGLVHHWSAYHYQVLSHPCPWCLFLPEQRYLGVAIYACMALVPAEALAFWAADRIRRRYAHLAQAARKRQRRAGRRILFALAGFLLTAGGPAVVWRLQHGRWLITLF